MLGTLGVLLFSAIGLGEASAQDETLIDDRTPALKLQLLPTVEPRIAFEHRLLPQLHELQDGDAAAFYGKAIQFFLENKQNYEILNELTDFEHPITEFPVEKAKQFLEQNRNCMEYIRYASLR